MAVASPLPFQQRAVLFSPPTQSILPSPNSLDNEKKGSRVARKLSQMFSKTNTTNSMRPESFMVSHGSLRSINTPKMLWPETPTPTATKAIGFDVVQASGGSFKSIKTPKVLWPETPTPRASMHPNFELNSGSSIRQGGLGFAPQASIPELHALPSTAVNSHQAAPSAVSAPVPTTQMVWVPMPVMQMPAGTMAMHQASTAGCSSMRANAESMPPVLLGRPGCPSVGSAMHGTGKCQPCAWFWKAGRGCQAGANCDHCHLCPEGEMKARKKAKVAAMRMGLL